MAVLRERDGGKIHPLRGKVTLIGRDPICDIVVGNPGASGRHAIIVDSGGIFYLEDLNSVNGTVLNRQRISQRTRLAREDSIEIPGLAVAFLDEGTGTARDTIQVPEIPGSASSAAPIVSSIDIGADLRLTVKPEAKLRAVLEISRNLSNTLDLKVVLPRTLESLFSIFPQADCGFILLRDLATGQLTPRAVRHRREPKDNALPLSRNIIDHVVRTKQAILSADAGSDTRFDTTQSISNLKIRSIMCVPMMSQGGAFLGIIQIDTRDRRNQFQQEDLDLLVCASFQAARTVELAQLHEERRDLEAATRIQKSFLPEERPRHRQVQFFDYYSPAQQVGGDYFDYIPLPGNKLAVALGDVAGKGISAALLMARLSSAVRFSLAISPTVSEAVRQINRVLIRSGNEDRFVTFVVAVLDTDRSEITMVNAGHMPPLLRRVGKEAVEVGDDIVGLPLAVMDRPYEELVVPIELGDTYLLYTDGVSEARNPANDMYGAERLHKAIRKAPEDVESFGRSILSDVRLFAGDRPQNDDLTIVCFRRYA